MLPIHVYNSLTRQKQEFRPLSPSEVKMYVCGPTVYDEPHIGHARSAYIFDVIRRYLKYKGYKVEFVRNVTDVDDKIIDKARQEFSGEDLNLSYKKIAQKYLDSYHEALISLGIGDSDIIEPKASEYISKMVGFIKLLIERGVAYQAGGDVYFDINKAKDYGKLSNQSLQKMEVGSRVSPLENKRNPLDFALWKSAKENEPSWESPWGRGRPGWHIECSVMSSDILGDEFDIHGGGIDLIFPHHENEIAQSESLGKKFAKFWIHHGLLTINGQKMAKSLGNFVTIKDIVEKYHPDVLKLFYLQAHYRSPIDYSEKKMEEVTEYYRSFALLFRLYRDNLSIYGDGLLHEEEKRRLDNYREEFSKAMDDDFNTPIALSVLNRAKSDAYPLNANFALECNWAKFQYLIKMIEELLFSNFGISPNNADLVNDDRLLTESVRGLRQTFKKAGVEDLESWKKEQEKQIEQLRREKKFVEADKKKEELRAKGFKVLDRKDGTTEIQ